MIDNYRWSWIEDWMQDRDVQSALAPSKHTGCHDNYQTYFRFPGSYLVIRIALGMHGGNLKSLQMCFSIYLCKRPCAISINVHSFDYGRQWHQQSCYLFLQICQWMSPAPLVWLIWDVFDYFGHTCEYRPIGFYGEFQNYGGSLIPDLLCNRVPHERSNRGKNLDLDWSMPAVICCSCTFCMSVWRLCSREGLADKKISRQRVVTRRSVAWEAG